ncbi:MAG TPA: hypothetical protein VK662_09350 [Acidothermaceae bacterium]|nr:hypothetical protein [Acidothermaceae bacterium]
MANQVDALAAAAERVERLDDSVPVADEVANAVLTDNRRIMRLAGPTFVLLSILLVPWTVFIAVALPSRQLSPNYDLAWAGFDVFLCVGLASTGYFALRRSRWLPVAAAATAAMLFVDAWFDVVTSASGRDLAAAVILAALVELPLSALCLFIARESQLANDKRFEMLLSGSYARASHGSPWAGTK